MEDACRDAAARATLAARDSYGKLLAILAARTRDVAAAEDALADAFAAAIAQWPKDGVPSNPVGWLLTVARRSAGHAAARRQTADRGAAMVQMLDDERKDPTSDGFGDDRLKLMFACTHPAIAVDAQAPLMLQTVLGLDAARIAASFLVAPTSMGQRLVRAKRRIRDAGIAFAIPEAEDIPARLSAVLSAIYAAYGTAWDDVAGADPRLAGLADEAIWLARLTVQLVPDQPEALGLLAMMLHCEARRAARRGPDGAFIALRDQDVALWSRDMMAEAEAALRTAARLGQPGRFQTEAAIQSLHAQSRMTGERLHGPLMQLYNVLARFAPTTGVLVARAVALAENGVPDAALSQLDAITGAETYQPWWAARARILWLYGQEEAARDAASRAAGLSSDPGIRRFLLSGGYRDGPR
ncbi:ECF-family sigma factor [Roseovarius sp. TM1035]|nr:RNA polymerase sigma-70 factor, ECF subfamily [Roseovarius sp. AK1035]EDM33007.1 ECF-family sigma factor [Roseovarius sp. TM1035]